MKTLNRFRIVKLSAELQKEFALPEFICADPEGLPFLEGNAFYHWLIDENACEATTARNYLSAVLAFLTFLADASPLVHYTAPAEQIRRYVRDYLRDKLGCSVYLHQNGNFVVKRAKPITATSARLFLTALKRFYQCATLEKWYTDPNPLVWTTRMAALERGFKPRMPPRSGVTLPDEKKGRVPDTYFCVVANEWHPCIIDDPQLRQRLVPAFIQTRDRVIVRILFDSGARIGEVLGLTMGDWQSLGQRERALAPNKGSRGERVKEIWWSVETAQLLRDYINQERRWCDPRQQRLEELPDTAPLFITDEGTSYTYKAFYANWRRACARIRIKLTPHQVRHWYVTMALHFIESLSDAGKRTAYRQSLVAYIGWRNPETIKTYDHHLRQLDFGPIHAALARLGETQSAAFTGSSPPTSAPRVGMNVISNELEQFLSQEFGWEA